MEYSGWEIYYVPWQGNYPLLVLDHLTELNEQSAAPVSTIRSRTFDTPTSNDLATTIAESIKFC